MVIFITQFHILLVVSSYEILTMVMHFFFSLILFLKISMHMSFLLDMHYQGIQFYIDFTSYSFPLH